jgi:hypothetical protein
MNKTHMENNKINYLIWQKKILEKLFGYIINIHSNGDSDGLIFLFYLIYMNSIESIIFLFYFNLNIYQRQKSIIYLYLFFKFILTLIIFLLI